MGALRGMHFDHAVIGGYDVRGLGMGHKGKRPNLTPKLAYHIGRALGSRLSEGSKVFVARDARLTSPALMEAVIEGYRDSGINVVANTDITPTGITTWAVVQQAFDGSVMVSGSHNPKPDNGLKITEHGEALYGAKLKELIPLVEQGECRVAEKRGTLSLTDVRPDYYQMLAAQSPRLTTRRNVILDAGNGIGGGFYPTLQSRIVKPSRGTVEGINLVGDGNFPAYGCADPSKPSCVDPVAAMVIQQNIATIVRAKGIDGTQARALLGEVDKLDQDLKEQLVIALILDGDADRCGFVDETGAPVWPEKMAAIFYLQYLRDLKAGRLGGDYGNFMALDVRASTATTRMVWDNNGSGWFIQAGYPAHRSWAKAIIDRINKRKVTGISAEASGHFFFPTALFGPDRETFDHAAASLIDDGIYASLRFLGILDSQPTFTTLHALMDTVPSSPVSREIRIDVDNVKKFEIVQALTDQIADRYGAELLPRGEGVMVHEDLRIQAPDEGLILVDGVRPQFAEAGGQSSFFLVRASNTSAKLTSLAEAPTREGLIHRLEQLKALVAGFGSSVDVGGIAREIEFQTRSAA